MVKRPWLIVSSKSFVGFWKSGLSSTCPPVFSWLFGGCQIKHGSAKQTINRVFFPGLGLNEQRPILVRLRLVAGDILPPKFIRAFGVLDNELAIHYGPD